MQCFACSANAQTWASDQIVLCACALLVGSFLLQVEALKEEVKQAKAAGTPHGAWAG